MKKIAKRIVAGILGWQVRRLVRKNRFKVVAVTGSIGKTSTKLAIVHVLSQSYKVQFQDGNYNDPVSVPLIFFGRSLPSLFNPIAWLAVFWKNESAIGRNYPYEVVVVELGTDAPGQIKQFSKYLHPDIGVLTAITPEHMEFFADIDAVAKEEIALVDFSELVLINKDLCPEKYLTGLSKISTYGVKKPGNIAMTNIKFDEHSASFDVVSGKDILVRAEHEQITEPQLYSICGAVAVAHELGMSPENIRKGISSIKPVSGRMRHLNGINQSMIIDDTYNASPEATRAALNTLYRLKAPQKIAVLGNMNELGAYSEEEHLKIGEYCDPKQLALVATIGPDANKFLAPAAESQGCNVKTFDSPYEAGDYIKSAIKNGAAILVKGSQNRVFAEEAIKSLLAEPKDSSKLVRQSPYWLGVKRKAFKTK